MSNIIARMAEPLPTIPRTAGQWLALSRKYAPLGKAIAARFGENINAHAFGHWLKSHEGESVDGVKLTGRHDKHKKQWLYRSGEPPPPAAPVYEPPAPMTEEERKAAIARELARMTPAPKPKPPEPPRERVRFRNANIVEGPSGTILKHPEPVSPLNPHYTTDAPRQAPYVPKPMNVIYTPNPRPRQPGVNYGQDGTQTRASTSGRSFSPFDF